MSEQKSQGGEGASREELREEDDSRQKAQPVQRAWGGRMSSVYKDHPFARDARDFIGEVS